MMEEVHCFRDVPCIQYSHRELVGSWQSPDADHALLSTDQSWARSDLLDACDGKGNAHYLDMSGAMTPSNMRRCNYYDDEPRPPFAVKPEFDASPRMMTFSNMSYNQGHDGRLGRPQFSSCRYTSPEDDTYGSSSSGVSHDGSYCGEVQHHVIDPSQALLSRSVDDPRFLGYNYPLSPYPSPPIAAARPGISPRQVHHVPDVSHEPSVELYTPSEHGPEYDPEEVRVPYHGLTGGPEEEDLVDENNGVVDGPHHKPVQPFEKNLESNSALPTGSATRNRRSRPAQSRANAGVLNGARPRGPSSLHTLPGKAANKVSKRSKPKKKSAGKGSANRQSRSSHPYPCPFAQYKCSSTFASKNEWKRHVSTQHVQLGLWRCDLCPHKSEGDYNEFNRKDLFIQHLRRMHDRSKTRMLPPKTSRKQAVLDPNNIDAREKTCYHNIRSPPPRSSCLFCPKTFDGPTSWDERMEHVASHLERKQKTEPVGSVDSWNTDLALQDWLLHERLIEDDGRGGWRLRSITARSYETKGKGSSS